MKFFRKKNNTGTPTTDPDGQQTPRQSGEKPTVHDLKTDTNSSGWGPPPSVARMTPEERVAAEVKLKRKIDIRLLPTLVVMYILNYLDRNAIASTRLGGITSDIGLVGNQFQTSVSILFVGYILMQVPSNLFLDRIGKPAIYLPACMVVWGTISALTATVQSFGGLIACRFFLGFVEAAYFPGCLFFLSSWYTRKELSFRTAVLYSGSLISGAFSGLIAAGIVGGLDGARGLRAWRWLFIIEGAMTVFVAICAFFILPNFPKTTGWLTPEERELAIWRLEEDAGEVDEDHRSVLWGFKLAIRDIRVYILMLMILCIVSSGGVTNFFPTVVASLNKSNVETLLLTVPPYVLAVITTFLNSLHADRTGERFFHIAIPLCFGLVAFIIAAATTSFGPRYFAMMLMPAGCYTGYVVGLAWISNTLPRPPAKRAAALALINAVSNATSIYVSYMYLDQYAPRFIPAFVVNAITILIAIASALVLRIMLQKLNKTLEMGGVVDGISIRDQGVENVAVGGETVQQKKHGFRYLV